MPGLETAPPLPPLLRNLLDPLPPHRAEDWQVRVKRDAPSPTVDEMVLWNAQAVHVLAGGSKGAARPTYAIQADDVVFRLPAGTDVHVRYHSPFFDGTVEQTLHCRPLEERLTLMHQLRDVLLTEEEEQQIRANMEPVRSDFMIGNHVRRHTLANTVFVRQQHRTTRTSVVTAYSGLSPSLQLHLSS
jgi:hypothetical protein